MAKMYGQLPSHIKANATIFDMQVTNAVLVWEKEQYDKANGNVVEHNLSQEEMMAMIKAARK
jgi:hypothetical protein